MIEQTENKIVYIVSDNPVFTFNLRFFDAADIEIYLNTDENQALKLQSGVDYTVEAKADYGSGANITLHTGTANIPVMPVGKKLTVIRRLPLIQQTSLPEYGRLPSKPLETQLDKIIMICQQFAEELARSVSLPPGSDLTPSDLVLAIVNAAAAAEKAEAAASSAQTAVNTVVATASEAKATASEAKATAESSLPLAGGTMTGNISFQKTNTELNKTSDNGELFLRGGSNFSGGGTVAIFGKDHATFPGQVRLYAQNAEGGSYLNIAPGGSCTVNGKSLSVIEAVWFGSNGSYYVKYTNGWMEQGGITANQNWSDTATVTFHQPFYDYQFSVQLTLFGSNFESSHSLPSCTSRAPTGFSLRNNSAVSSQYSWVARGKWK